MGRTGLFVSHTKGGKRVLKAVEIDPGQAEELQNTLCDQLSQDTTSDSRP